ncbi:MAG TPA: hypothetical protein VFP91_05350 [Vicinamibacterales bacterium]|nr:hypothetical protein [Vicinamibacterales bacterium]
MILKGLGSRVLSCGCMVGIYETYGGTTVAMIDAVDPACLEPTHRLGAVVNLSVVEPPAPANRR